MKYENFARCSARIFLCCLVFGYIELFPRLTNTLLHTIIFFPNEYQCTVKPNICPHFMLYVWNTCCLLPQLFQNDAHKSSHKKCHIFMALKLTPLTLCPVFMTPWNVSRKTQACPPSFPPFVIPIARNCLLIRFLLPFERRSTVFLSLLVFHALCNPPWVFI